jgi:glutaredoxin
MKNILNWLKADKFRLIMLVILTSLFVYLANSNQGSLLNAETPMATEESSEQANSEDIVQVFHSPYCPHCIELKKFIKSDLRDKYPTVVFEMHDVTQDSERGAFTEALKTANLDPNTSGVPFVLINNEHLIGFRSPETTGETLINMIDRNFFLGNISETCDDSENCDTPTECSHAEKNEVETFFGSISLDRSLPVLAITLGLVDGFNPCAMWVLIYLISIIVTLKDKKKMWLIVGTFVTAEAILYYVLLNFWLSAFLLVGAIRIITLMVGIVAIYFGSMDLKQYFLKEDMVCKVGNLKSKNRTKNKIKSLADAEITIATILGLIGLAFVVNSMEFMCSAGIPAVFSQVLANAGISGFMKQMYIILYDIFFMIDDFIVFGLAVFAIDKYVGDKYMRLCKLIGGGILVILGILMLFFPELLR